MDDETGSVVALRRRPNDFVLAPREREIMSLLAEGLNCSEIARALGLSPPIVRSHLSEIFLLLGVRDRLGALAAFQVAGGSVGGGRRA